MGGVQLGRRFTNWGLSVNGKGGERLAKPLLEDVDRRNCNDGSLFQHFTTLAKKKRTSPLAARTLEHLVGGAL